MTRKEFYLRSIISMAGNPNYVDVSICPPDEILDEETTSRILNKEEVLEDAAELLIKTEEAWAGVFDEDDVPEETPKRLLYDLCAAVEELTCPDGKMDILNDRMLDIRNSLSGLNDSFAKLTEADEEDEELDDE